MKTELPYFQFFVKDWINGNVYFEDYNTKGMFIDLCANFWLRGCEFSVEDCAKRLPKVDLKLLESLSLISIKFEKIHIKFLEEQFAVLSEKRIKQSVGGKEGYKRKLQGNLQGKLKDSLNLPNELPQASSDTDTDTNKPLPLKTDLLDFEKLLNFLNTELKREYTVMTSATRAQYRLRIQEGYTAFDIERAVKSAKEVKIHKDNNYQYLTPEFFSRSEVLSMYGAKKNIETPEEKLKREAIERDKRMMGIKV